jgi:hypothetical protein
VTAPTLTPPEESVDSDADASRRSPAALWGALLSILKGIPGRISATSLRDAGHRPWLTGLVAGVWAAALGLVIGIVPLLLTWIATPSSGLTWPEASRLGGLIWVVAQGTPVAIGAVTYSLLPWGLAAIPLLLLGYAGGWAARRASVRSTRELIALVAAGVLAYSVVVGVVASTTARADSSTGTVDAILRGVLLSTAALAWGATRSSGLRLADVAPGPALLVTRAGLLGALAILGAGAVAAAAATLVRVDDAVTMAQSLHAGVWGGLALLLLGLAYVPVAIVWSSSYLLGAGFAIGPSVVVSPFIPVTSPTQLPPFPLLASVPQSATPVAWALPLVGIAAGVLVGLAVARGARKESRLTRLALALGAAAVTALVLLAASYLADGSLGDVRLAHLGPRAATVGLLAFILVAAGAVPSAVVAGPPAQRRLAVTVVDEEPLAEADPASAHESQIDASE